MRLSQLHPNDGQIEGVPRNPRQINEEEFKKLKKSLKNFYKMLALRPIQSIRMVATYDWQGQAEQAQSV